MQLVPGTKAFLIFWLIILGISLILCVLQVLLNNLPMAAFEIFMVLFAAWQLQLHVDEKSRDA